MNILTSIVGGVFGAIAGACAYALYIEFRCPTNWTLDQCNVAYWIEPLRWALLFVGIAVGLFVARKINDRRTKPRTPAGRAK